MDINRLNDTISKLKIDASDKDYLQKSQADKLNQIKKLEDKVQELGMSNSQLQSAIRELAEDKDRMGLAQQNLQAENDQMRGQIQQQLEQILGYQQQEQLAEQLQSANQELKKTLADKETEIQNAQERNEQLQTGFDVQI